MLEIKDLIKKLVSDQEEIYSLIAVVNEVDEEKRTCNLKPVNGTAELFDVRLQSSVNSETGVVLFPKIGSYVVANFISKELAYITKTDQITKIKVLINETSIEIDEDNFITTVKNNKLNAREHEVNSKNVTFTVEELFKLVSSNEIDLSALKMLLKATNVEIEGITKITGKTDIIGAATITGALVVTGGGAISGGMEVNGGANGGVPLSEKLASKLNAIETDINNLKALLSSWTPAANDGGGALKAVLTTYLTSNLAATTEAEISNDDFTQ
jgi:hypothetical protein